MVELSSLVLQFQFSFGTFSLFPGASLGGPALLFAFPSPAQVLATAAAPILFVFVMFAVRTVPNIDGDHRYDRHLEGLPFRRTVARI